MNYPSGTFLEVLRKTQYTSLGAASLKAEIWTRDLPKKNW